MKNHEYKPMNIYKLTWIERKKFGISVQIFHTKKNERERERKKLASNNPIKDDFIKKSGKRSGI